ncbi:MAG: HD-GYP domain-containing protein, partial [Gemmatimonadota bacterium]
MSDEPRPEQADPDGRVTLDPFSAEDKMPTDDAAGVALRVSEVLASLSFALDVTEGQPEGHSIRNTMIGMRLAEEIGLSEERESALFYALLLKDLGCSSNAAKICYLFGTDDHAVKRDVKTRDWSSFRGTLEYLYFNVARGGTVLDKLRSLWHWAKGGEEAARELIEIRCEQGADIARMLGFPEETVRAIHDLDEHWDGNGYPDGLEGEEISYLARILSIAQTVEVFVQEYDLQTAYEMAEERRGTWFDPDLVDALHAIRDDEAFWESLRTDDPREELRSWEPEDRVVPATDERLDLISRAFARVVDAKSPWTYRHSERVTELALAVGRRLGMDHAELRELRRAALLHDIGKLGVSNMILDKEGELTDEEYEQVKQHPVYSRKILARVSPFEEVAEIAGRHHERLDGSGYDRGLSGEELSAPERALSVADVYEALRADRPYRDAFS